MPRRHLTAAVLAAAVTLLAASSAHATTFCVPDFTSACPDDGTNVKLGSLETAMQANHADGVKDTIHVAAGTVTDPDTFETHSSGTDPLEIVGASRALTVVTSTSNANAYVMNLEPGARAVTLRNLTIRVPATMPDGGGAALQARKAVLEQVNVDVRNDGGDGVTFVGGGTFRGGRLSAGPGGSLDLALRVNGAASGPLTIEDTEIVAPSWGIIATAAAVPVTARRTTITSPVAYGARISDNGALTMENCLITTTGDAHAVSLEGSSAAGGASFLGDHLTIAGSAQTGTAIEAKVNAGVAWSSIATLRNSIVRGYPATFARTAPAGAGSGGVTLTFTNVNAAMTGTATGNGATVASGGIDADPKFAGTGAAPFALQAGSPSIDRGIATAITDDLAGAPRPTDGDGDGTAAPDQGAYEYQPPPTAVPTDPEPPTAPSPQPPAPAPVPTPATPESAPLADTVAPRLTGLRVTRALSRRRGGTIRFTLSEDARVQLRFSRTVKGRTRTVTLTVRGRAGQNTLRVARRRLAAGRYRLRAVATDAAGNRATTPARRVTVRR